MVLSVWKSLCAVLFAHVSRTAFGTRQLYQKSQWLLETASSGSRCLDKKTACSGDTCCEPFAASNGLTYPCPASSHQFTKSGTCQASPCQEGTAVTTVMCADGITPCTGNVCCPGLDESGGVTYPCPSALPGYSKCGSTEKVMSCSAGLKLYDTYIAQIEAKEKRFSENIDTATAAMCADGVTKCRGNMCCPGFEGSGDKSYPCPMASREFSKFCQLSAFEAKEKRFSENIDTATAEAKEKRFSENIDTATAAMCADGVTRCRGNMCCPGFEGSGDKSYPCPMASREFSKFCQLSAFEAKEKRFSENINTATKAMCADGVTKCRGNQCCPGFEGSGHKSYPCPVASKEFSKVCQLSEFGR